MNASNRLDATFLALADPTRRAILARLIEGEASVAELAAPFSISQPAISKHLKILERAGLVSTGQDGQRRPRRIEPQPLAEASAWLERYREIWETSFARLDALLYELQREPPLETPERVERKPSAESNREHAERKPAAESDREHVRKPAGESAGELLPRRTTKRRRRNG